MDLLNYGKAKSDLMAKSKTSYPPGTSGNKGGRPKGIGEIRALAKTYSPEVIDILVSLARDQNVRASDRIVCASILLNYAVGLPSKDSDTPEIDELPIHNMTTMQLQTLLQQYANKDLPII